MKDDPREDNVEGILSLSKNTRQILIRGFTLGLTDFVVDVKPQI
jgi:hypothetical protein